MSEVINIKELNERIERESVFVDTLRTEMGKVIVGQTHLVDTLLIGLLSNGHILLEGVPGLAKTLAITTLAKAVDACFSRIQFTPDLLPADAAQRHYAQRMADDRRIDQRIYLLQKKPEQHRNGKLPDPRNRLSNCQILCHSCAPPVCCGYPLYHIFSNCQFNFVRIRLIYVIIFVHNGHKLCCRAAARSRQSFFMLSLQFVLIFFSVISDSCSMLKAQKQKTHTHRKDARKGDFQYV